MKALLAAAWGMVAMWVVPAGAAGPAAAHDFAGRVGFDQHLNRQVPADLPFRDESGHAVSVHDYLGAAPVGVVFSYFTCSNMCPAVIHNLAERVGQSPRAQADRLQVVVVSVDPRDSPATAYQAKLKYLRDVLPATAADRWHFLTGAQADIAQLADAVGFRYAYDAASQQYAHPAGLALLTAQGRIARYFFGFDFTAAELSRAIDEASAQRIASPIERLLLVCFHYDPVTGRYSATIASALRGISAAMLVAALMGGWLMRRRTRRSNESGR
jgi:protein SCO1